MVEAGRKAVVVGFDHSELSRHAVRWAAREASSRRRPLLLVHMFTWPFEEATMVRLPGREDMLEPLQDNLRRELAVFWAKAAGRSTPRWKCIRWGEP